MSNDLAIAAVTLMMRNLLDQIEDMKDTDEYNLLPADAKPTTQVLVTTLPLDKAYEYSTTKNQVNIFLYHVEQNPAWRNMDIPGRIRPGETGYSPLALNLYYIITAYGENGSELIGHVLMGKAMSILHDHVLMGRTEIRDTFGISDLHKQVERLRITPHPISVEEVSKLWTGFQTQYRLSAAYEVSVVLIESKRTAKTPLPVLTRGKNDTGIEALPQLTPPYPTLETISFPGKRTSALLGDIINFSGHHLDGNTVTLRFIHPNLATATEVPALPNGTDKKLSVQIYNNPDVWPAGFYRVEAIVDKAGNVRTTNQLSISLLPDITSFTTAPLSPPVADGYMATVTCIPQVLPEQSVSLLLGNREFPVPSRSTPLGTLNIRLHNVSAGNYYIRLRVDGVDSLVIDHSGETPVFDTSREVSIP